MTNLRKKSLGWVFFGALCVFAGVINPPSDHLHNWVPIIIAIGIVIFLIGIIVFIKQ